MTAWRTTVIKKHKVDMSRITRIWTRVQKVHAWALTARGIYGMTTTEDTTAMIPDKIYGQSHVEVVDVISASDAQQ